MHTEAYRSTTMAVESIKTKCCFLSMVVYCDPRYLASCSRTITKFKINLGYTARLCLKILKIRANQMIHQIEVPA